MNNETVPPRTVTAGIESSARPGDVVALLRDATRAPEWAPGFADLVEHDPAFGWRVTKGDRQVDIEVEVHEEAGTVDYVRDLGDGRRGGAYLRATPRPGGGSVMTMTIPLLPGQDVSEGAGILDGELHALARLLEAPDD